MKIKYLILCLIMGFLLPISRPFGSKLMAQVAINTDGTAPSTNTILDLNPAIGKAFVPPKMTYAQIKAISPASEGMLVYDTEFKTMRMYNGTRWMNLTQQVDLPGTFTTQGATTLGTNNAATVDAAGNIYLAGDFTGTIAFGGSAGSLTATTASGATPFIPNAYVVKYNASGVAQWARQGGYQNNDTFGVGVAVDGSGNVFITGAFFSETRFNGVPLFAAGIIDAFIVKYNSSGTFQWAIRGGGTGEDGGSAITTDASGNVYIAGYLTGTATFDMSSVLGAGTISVTGTAGGSNDAFVAKYSATGVAAWVKSGGGSGVDRASRVATDASGNVYMAGYFNATAVFAATPSPISIISAGLADAFTAKYDVNGNIQWVKRAGGAGDDISLIQAIAADASGNVYITGAYSGTLTVAPLAPITSAGGFDILLLKYNSTGVEQWIKSAGGASTDYASGIATDALGAVFVTGRFTGTGFFGTLPSITSAGSEDVFLIKYDSSGGDQWVQKAGGAGSDYGRVVFIAPSGAVFTLGNFVPTAQFATQSLTTGNTFVMKYME